VIWSRHAKPWTKCETARADRMAVEIGCIFCWLDEGHRGPCDHRHHVKRGTTRMGHWYTLPLCEKHHAACHNGTINNARQLDAWVKTQHALDLSDELPTSKIFKRESLLPEAEVSKSV